MRKFNHWQILKVACDTIYVVSFMTFLTFCGSVAAKEEGLTDKHLVEIFYDLKSQKQLDCQNCDEID